MRSILDGGVTVNTFTITNGSPSLISIDKQEVTEGDSVVITNIYNATVNITDGMPTNPLMRTLDAGETYTYTPTASVTITADLYNGGEN